MYIWHDPVFVFHGVPLTAPSLLTRTKLESETAIGRVCDRYPKPVPTIVTGSGGGVAVLNASDCVDSA
jgi:hypothetical protein